MKTPRNPQDRRKYPRHPQSNIARPGLSDGEYVFVQDLDGTVWVVPDGPHVHPKVLGGGQPALYAGTLRISGQVVLELTNLSGTFRCDDDDGLVIIADWLRQQGWHIARDSVRFFPFDGGTPYIVQP